MTFRAAVPAAPQLILHLEAPNKGGQGDSVYRTVQPCRALGQLAGVDVIAGSYVAPQVHPRLLLADVLVLCDVVEADLIPVIKARRLRGLPTIYEINDDFLAMQAWNPNAYLGNNPVSRSLSSRLASLCDGVQFSTPYLQQRFGYLCNHTAVFTNNLWELPAHEPRPKSSVVRVGWGGSIGHRADFEALLNIMAPLLQRYPNVHFSVMGDESFRGLCERLPPGRWDWRLGGPLTDYFAFLATLDVGLAPLEPTDFNLGRSDVKFLEYAAFAVPCVAAALPPYEASVEQNVTGLLYRNDSELSAALVELIEDKDKRSSIGQAARAYVQQHRLESPRAKERLAFMQACAARAQSGAPLAPPRDVWSGFAHDEPASYPDSSVRLLARDGVVAPLLEGLAALRDGDVPTACRSFAAATAVAPTFYVPWLYKGSADPDHSCAVAALNEALKLHASPSVLLARADRWQALGNREAAKADLNAAAQLAPEIGLPFARLADIAQHEGDVALSIELEARALKHNPYFALPHVRRVLSALEGGASPDMGALATCLACDDRYWATHFAFGAYALRAQKLEEARQHFLAALKHAPDAGPVCAQLARVEATAGNLAAAKQWLQRAVGPHRG